MFKADPQHLLPRVFCYFDDTVGGPNELYNEFTGQRGAIEDYNKQNETRKLARPYYLYARRVQQPWYQQIFIHHDFGHPLYNTFLDTEAKQLLLLS